MARCLRVPGAWSLAGPQGAAHNPFSFIHPATMVTISADSWLRHAQGLIARRPAPKGGQAASSLNARGDTVRQPDARVTCPARVLRFAPP